MTEVIQNIKKNKLLSYFNTALSENKLLKFRKYLMLTVVFLIISTVIDYYVAKAFTINIAIELIISLICLTFINKAETLMLKMKVEKLLEEKIND